MLSKLRKEQREFYISLNIMTANMMCLGGTIYLMSQTSTEKCQNENVGHVFACTSQRTIAKKDYFSSTDGL